MKQPITHWAAGDCVEYDLRDFERGTTFLALEEKFKVQCVEADWIYNRRYSLEPICIGGLMIAPAECEMLVEGSTIRVRTGDDAFDRTIVFLSPDHARSALPRVQAGEFFYVADDTYLNGLPVTGDMRAEKLAMQQNRARPCHATQPEATLVVTA